MVSVALIGQNKRKTRHAETEPGQVLREERE